METIHCRSAKFSSDLLACTCPFLSVFSGEDSQTVSELWQLKALGSVSRCSHSFLKIWEHPSVRLHNHCWHRQSYIQREMQTWMMVTNSSDIDGPLSSLARPNDRHVNVDWDCDQPLWHADQPSCVVNLSLAAPTCHHRRLKEYKNLNLAAVLSILTCLMNINVDRLVGYLPAGYKPSPPPASVSSLSEGSFSSEHRQLSDDIAEFAKGRSEYVFDDLHCESKKQGTTSEWVVS